MYHPRSVAWSRARPVSASFAGRCPTTTSVTTPSKGSSAVRPDPVLGANADVECAGVSELARRLDLSKRAVHKHLTTPESLDYVLKDDRFYQLELGTVTRSRLDIYRAARLGLERLADATGETASLTMLEHGYGRYVFRAPHGDDDDLTHIIDSIGLPTVTEDTITDCTEFEDEIRSIRDARAAYDREEQVSGVAVYRLTHHRRREPVGRCHQRLRTDRDDARTTRESGHPRSPSQYGELARDAVSLDVAGPLRHVVLQQYACHKWR